MGCVILLWHSLGLLYINNKPGYDVNLTVNEHEPRHTKINILHMRKKNADQLRGNREADQRLCFRYIDSAIPLLSKSEISSL